VPDLVYLWQTWAEWSSISAASAAQILRQQIASAVRSQIPPIAFSQIRLGAGGVALALKGVVEWPSIA